MYAELHVRTYFSFLDGASRPAELLQRARDLGLPALAIADRDGLHGVVETRDDLLELCGLSRRTQEPDTSLRLIYGSELHFDDDVAVALVRTREGYANLSETITAGRLAAEKGEFLLSFDQLARRTEGLTLLAGGPGSAAMKRLIQGEGREAEASLGRLRDAFGKHLSVELVRHLAPGDRERSIEMARVARRLGIPIVATNDVYFHERARKPLHDVLRCVREGCTLREAGRRLLPNGEAHLKGHEEMAALFSDLPEAIEQTEAIVESIRFRLCELKYRPPAPDLPEGETADSQLARLSREGLYERLGPLADRYISKLEGELAIIRQLDYAGYFLIMWQIVNECRRRGILCQGRGSAANSLVCYALKITSVSPQTIHMLFARFLSVERAEPPDIDLDIEHERREEIIQHVFEKYTRDHAGMVSEVIRYRHRSAVNDVGKVLGFPPEQLARLSRFMSHGWADENPRAFDAAGIDPDHRSTRLLFETAHLLSEFPRHLSIHVGGFILSEERLARSVPIENGRMKDRTVIQWDKNHVDSMGMFKLDLLGLGMLTVIAKTFALLRQRGVELTLETVPQDDPPTYAMLRQADTVGVFQVESRAQMSMLPRLKPEVFYDLVIEVAIVRPGPIQGGMVHPYLRRKEGLEKEDYPLPELREVLSRTLGVPLFQEQVIHLATAVGGYTAGEADQLRRDLGSWRADGRIGRHRARLTAHMLSRGLPAEFAERICSQLEGFASYGFPESHAAAFAQLAYVSAYLKRHYPAEFAAGLLNSQPMGFYSPAVIINDAKRHDVEIRPIDVARSGWDCAIEEGAVRLGLRLVRGLGEEAARSLVRARESAPFVSVADLRHRTGLTERKLVPLAAAGALRSLHRRRREALWSAMYQSSGPLFDGIAPIEPAADLPDLPPLEKLRMDVTYGGAFPGKHPMQYLRAALDRQGILPARELRTAELDRQVRVAGLVITRQRPGEGKVIYVTLEDETGHADCALFERVFARFEETIRLSSALVIQGRLRGTGDARNISVSKVWPLSVEELPAAPSHDFH